MAMEFKRRLPIPMEIREEMPLSAELTAKKQAFDAEVAKVFTGEDARRFFYENHLRFSPDMEVATTDQILPMVRCNLGIGFCPEGIARPAIERKEVFEIELEEEIPERQITIVEDSGKPQSIAVQKLLTYFK